MRMPLFRRDRACWGALSGRILFWGQFSHGVAMGWKKSAPYGASDLAKIRAGFLHKAERLLHGAQIAKNLENSDKWYYAFCCSFTMCRNSNKDTASTFGDKG